MWIMPHAFSIKTFIEKDFLYYAKKNQTVALPPA
jgi:hypothetical protein